MYEVNNYNGRTLLCEQLCLLLYSTGKSVKTRSHYTYGAVQLYVLIELVLTYDGVHTAHGVIRRRFDVTVEIESCSISAVFLPYGAMEPHGSALCRSPIWLVWSLNGLQCNCGNILYRFRNKAGYWSKTPIFHTRLQFLTCMVSQNPLNFFPKNNTNFPCPYAIRWCNLPKSSTGCTNQGRRHGFKSGGGDFLTPHFLASGGGGWQNIA